MGVKTGTVLGVNLLLDAPLGGSVKNALVTFSMPAFASTDTGTLAVATAIQNTRRNGKTVTLLGACQAPEANGLYAGTNTTFRTGTLAISANVSVTFHMTDSAGVDADSPNTHTQSVGTNPGDLPFQSLVAYTEA